MTIPNLQGLESYGPWAAIPVYVLALAAFVPNSVMGLAAGAMFGAKAGFLVMIVSSTISAGMMFMAGRHLTRGWVYKKIETNPKVRHVDDAVTAGGWKMVALLRHTAVLPFCVMNYALGWSKIPFRDYILATSLSMMPGAFLYAYLGAMAGDVVFSDRKLEKTPLEWAFVGVGVVITMGVGIYAARRAKKILNAMDGK